MHFLVNEEKNLKKILKGIAQNGCLLPSLCCPEGLTPFPEHTAQFSPFSESGMEAKISPTFIECSTGRAGAHSEHLLCAAKHPLWSISFGY